MAFLASLRRGLLGRMANTPDLRGTSSADSRLAAIKAQLTRPLIVLDVGCRWGFADMWTRLAPHVFLYGFDPDEEECAELRGRYKGQPVELVPYALADRAGRRTLHVTKDPACSSLYKPDPVFTSTMPALDCAAEARVIEIDVRTLDDWAAEAKPGPIDFLKLDTQGAELDILRGAEQSLRDVKALEVEVEFNPIYVGQPLFGDVDRHLRERGFVLWKLSTLAHYTRGSTGLSDAQQDTHFFDTTGVTRAVHGGQLMWGHAYFVRKDIAEASASLSADEAVRSAALMAVLGFTDLADRLMARAG
jgi:FkbM family methyltransferase